MQSQFETLTENIKADFISNNNYEFDKKQSSLLTILIINLLFFIVKLFIIWWITEEQIYKRMKERHRFIGACIRTELFFNRDYNLLSRQQKMKLKDTIISNLENLTYSTFQKLYKEAKDD